jgi:uncharacterized protein DUF4019
VSRIGLLTSALGALALLFVWQAASAQEPGAAHKDAVEAARTFLALVDQGKYAESWDACALALKDAIKKDSWAGILSGNRSRLGKLESRKFEAEDTVTTVPGGPDGQYVILSYHSAFTGKKKTVAVTEVVTVMQDEDKQWRAFRYFVRRGKVPLP